MDEPGIERVGGGDIGRVGKKLDMVDCLALLCFSPYKVWAGMEVFVYIVV